MHLEQSKSAKDNTPGGPIGGTPTLIMLGGDHVVSKALEDKITKATIYKIKRFSDHAPLIVDYDFEVPNIL